MQQSDVQRQIIVLVLLLGTVRVSRQQRLHPGHGIFEGRKAALVDALMQSFMDAPLFVWMEVAFALGYDPALSHQLHSAVVAQHAEWAKAAA